MTIPVLVVGADPELAALIRSTLEAKHGCRVAVAGTSSEALAATRAAEFRLAIIDFDLPDRREADLVRRLRSLQPNLLLMAMTSDPVVHADDPLGVHVTLPKPFYLPDLVDQVEKLLRTLPPMSAEADASLPEAVSPRLGEAAEAARLAARGARDSGAYLVLLTREGRRWVHAGPMPPTHVEQVVAKLRHYGIDSETPGAVARYLRLPGASDAFLLYSLAVADVYLLSVLYPSRVPFGSVRRQAARLAEMFMQPRTPPAAAKPASPKGSPLQAEETMRLPSDWMPQAGRRRALPFAEQGSPEAVLAAAPPAEPAAAAPPAQPAAAAPPAQPAAAPPPAATPTALPDDWLPAMASILGAEAAAAVPLPSREPRQTSPLQRAPQRISLVYVPRDPALALQGSLASTLVAWTKEICRAQDFRPIDIHVRPDALCLTVELPPNASPPSAAHRVRQEISRRIAETFPSQAAAAASGRFWTSRYLLMSGDPPTSQRISEFVRETRGTSPLRPPG
jgi:CheY-like chemotaxis protein/REP element-mobilizing transposase RayT